MNTGTFYNSTGQTGAMLTASKDGAKKDEDLILDFMREHPTNTYSACDVWGALLALSRINDKKPLTSIRRAMNTLMCAKKVMKLQAMKEGIYGKPVHTWVLRGPAKQETLILQ
jgi:hypothetical protein